MKQVIIAFDIDGTLIGENDRLNPQLNTMVRILCGMKNVTLIAWSGGGAEYARTICRKYRIDIYFSGFYSKLDAPHIDIAFDDVPDFDLGDKNIII